MWLVVMWTLGAAPGAVDVDAKRVATYTECVHERDYQRRFWNGHAECVPAGVNKRPETLPNNN